MSNKHTIDIHALGWSCHIDYGFSYRYHFYLSTSITIDMSLDKSRPFVHEKYRKLVRKKDLKNEAHGKNVTKVFFVR
jgi:hypothetical protein